ncbi:MAG: hypothetical protein AAF298_00255 [Cyanobacteria bacterium P01_A01_bin.40]
MANKTSYKSEFITFIMKKLFLIFCIFLLTGCNQNNNFKTKYKAWRKTYWGMPEQELINYLSKFSSSIEMNRDSCSKNHVSQHNTYTCDWLSFKNYAVGNQQYRISFRLDNNRLAFISFSINENLENHENLTFEEKHNNFIAREKKSKIAYKELYNLLEDKYGEPDEIKSLNYSLSAYWYDDYTEIELTNSSINNLSFRPNNDVIYLENMPKDYDKI